ncbi:Gfo/Idh/MocA family oxidoreductase [Streptomyces sp. NBC_01220]|uniref:Gfo/Idh/MocA family protein n=1 Tax=unclassified Streptomyces TaxID=2593676 RepID=UPI002E2DE9DC|nr:MULTISPECIES: Gfo/Idh/MocA family oxidoreductase [unclassified Streptomyces]WSQ45632.1 Gfo/Idh/MocA family oxidoreductase [Streptomyces sp. NBC_01220]
MRIGVIGVGVIAPFFLQAIEDDPELRLTAVCDLDQAKLTGFPPGTVMFTDHRDLLASGLVDGVVVTLPNHAHAPVVADALRAGVHVCCEKPLTVHAADAHRLIQLADEHGTTLFTAFHRRYNTHVQDLADRLPEPELISHVTSRYQEKIEEHTGADRWYQDLDRCGGGCIIDNGPNALDALETVLGPLTLTDATIGDVRSGVEFCAELSLATAGGIPVHVDLDWALETGERKDITVHLKDGRELHADMLDGFEAFKSSLDHEYAGIMADFHRVVRDGRSGPDRGPHIVDLVEEAYGIGRTKEQRLRMAAKEPVSAHLVKLLFHRRTDRGMRLSPWQSRCVRAGDVHELVTTTDRPSATGDRVDHVGFLGFAEFPSGTVIDRGDVVSGPHGPIGRVAGFDECHAPNHYNILIDTERVLTAEDLDLHTLDTFTFSGGTR